MKSQADEERLLQSTAFQSAQSILQARQRAEEELVRAKETLEARARELARSVATLRATLESTTDGILVTGPRGEFVDHNLKLLDIWGLSSELLVTADPGELWQAIARHAADPDPFRGRLAEIVASRSESFDQLDLADGRVLEVFSTVQVVDELVVGRVWSFRDVTDRKLHELALSSSHAQFSAIIHHSPVGILLADSNLRLRQVNPIAQPMLGGIGPMVGRDLREVVTLLWPEPAASEILGRFRATLSTGEPYVCHLFAGFRRDRPVEEHYDWELHRLTLPDGQHGVACYLLDITEHVRAQDALRESAQRLRLALSAGHLGDWSWDAASDLVSMGERAAQSFGLTPGQPVTWAGLRERLHPDDREQARMAVETALLEHSDYDIEYRLQGSSGDETWIAAKGRGVYAADGAAIGMIGVVQDVSERKKLEILQLRLAAVVESSDDAILSKDLNGVIRTWNKGAERIFGYTEAEMVGNSILRLIPAELRDEETRILERQRSGERIDHYETVRVTQDGRRIDVSLTVSPIRDASGRIVGASKVARDITERKRTEAELRASAIENARLYEHVKRAAEDREQMLEAERTARSEAERVSHMKDEFLATLSHELRTPLNAIVGWSQLLRMRGHADAEVLEGLAVIDRNARVQAQLIEDLLDMSRIISGKVRLDVQRVDLQEVVGAAIASVRPSAESKSIRVQVVLDPHAGPVWGDPSRLQQCFWNLLSNAIKFTPKGGRVQVSLARVDSQLEFTVVDDGQGIAPDFLPHVFERFRQADSSTTRYYGGLGLGLSIVKSLVELHGGTVRAESAGTGLGATFCIELPVMVVGEVISDRRREHPANRTVPVAPLEHPSLHGITVLAVDDEPDARGLVKRVLEECGARVFVAASAKDGLEILIREKPDILISDIGMPNEDGYTLIRQVRQLPPEQGGRIPAAALSAFARPEDRTRALRAGYQMHLSKPVEPTELTAVVASLASRP